MNVETLSAARFPGRLWTKRALAPLIAAFVLLATHAAIAQTLNLGTNLVDISQAKGNETDPSIAINPLNPSNMVVVAASDRTNGGLFFAYSTNMGSNWVTNFIATNSDTTGLNPSGGPYAEPSMAFDAYGNLFLAYLPSSFLGVAVAVSTNGGQSFASLTNLAQFDVTDQPRITAPAGGAAAGSAWVIYKDYTTPNSPVQVQSLLSTGAGAIGTFGIPEIVPGSTNGGFADIAVGPLGHVLVAYQDNLVGQPDPAAYPTANIWVSLETNPVSGGIITNTGFKAPVLVASNALGGITYIAAAPNGIGINAAPGLAWNYDSSSTNFDDAYLIYTSLGSNGNAVIGFLSTRDMTTNVITGTNLVMTNFMVTNYMTNIIITNGVMTNIISTNITTTNETLTNYSTTKYTFTNTFITNWSSEVFVDDDAVTGSNDHFLPRVAVDPFTGFIFCSWYDCRNDQGAASPAITNRVTTNFVFTASLITNVTVTGATLETNFANGTNYTVIISANNVTNTLMTSDLSSNVFIDSSNIDIMLMGTNTNTTKVTVILTNIDTLAYTSGNGANKEAVVFATSSTDGGRIFGANQQVNPASQAVASPAVGIASDAADSDSLTGWGHYTALAAYAGNFFPAWADNSDVTTNNPDGANTNFDIYTPSLPAAGTISAADLSIFVTTSPSPTNITSAETVTFFVVVSNGGPQKASPAVMVTNILSTNLTLLPNTVVPALNGTFSIVPQTTNTPEEIIFTLPAMAKGAVLTNTFRMSATVSSIATNIATVGSPVLNFSPTNTTNQLVMVISGQDLAMGLTVSETNLLVGDTVASWITVTNLGPASNGPVFITNQFSTNWGNVTVYAQGTNQVTNSSSGPLAIVDLGLLPVGQPVTAMFTAVVLTGSTSATESALVASQDVDTNLLNNSAQVSSYVNDESLVFGMTQSSTSVNLAQTVTYQLAVTNLGLSYSGLVTVSNGFSPNLGQFSVTQSQGTSTVSSSAVVFNLGTLGAGEIATMTITAVAVGGPTLATNITIVSSTDFNTNTAGLNVTNLLTVNDEDLSITVTPTPTASAQVGQLVTFNESVDNIGLSANGVVMVTNTFSTNFGSITVLQPATGYTISGSVVTLNLGVLSLGQVVPITVTAVPTSVGSGTNVVGVGSLSFDTNLANNTSTNKFTFTAAQPVITNIVVTPTPNSAIISFNTGFPGTAQVVYGLTTNYGSITTPSTTPSTNHAVVLTGLTANTNYYFEILATVNGKLYTTNGAFTTTSTLILGTENASYQGLWNQGSDIPGIYGGTYQYSTTTNVSSPTAWAIYDPTIPASGLYNLYIWYPQNATFTTNAQVYVTGGTNEFIAPVNQTTNGGGWFQLATNTYWAAGTNGTVILYNNTHETNKYLVANAMMWTYVASQDNPTNGTVPAWWANLYFGTNVNGYVNGAADVNGTGYSIFDDYVLGLNPTTNGASTLSFTMSPVSNGTVTFTFSPYQGGRNYQIEVSTNLPVWTALTNTYTLNANGIGSFTVTQTNSSAVFYRLLVQIP